MFGVNFVRSSENCRPAELEKEHCLPLFKNKLMAIFPKFKKTLVCCLPFPHSLLLILFAFILPIFFCVSCDFLSFDHVMLFVWCFVFVSIPCYIPFSASLLLWTLRHFVDQDCYCKSENYLFILENFSL